MAHTAQMRRLVKRSEFLRAARGRRANRPGFSLQSVKCAQEDPGIGFTVTKKVGNAPERNRIKRRLRAAVLACADHFQPHHDYVLIGRRDALALPFSELVSGLQYAADTINSSRKPGNRT